MRVREQVLKVKTDNVTDTKAGKRLDSVIFCRRNPAENGVVGDELRKGKRVGKHCRAL